MRTVSFVLATIVAVSTSNAAEPKYNLNRGKKSVVSISNLVDRHDCHPSKLVGRVATRSFNTSGTIPTSVTIEHKSGERTYVNIDTDDLKKLSMVDAGWVVNGLQTLLRPKRRVSLGVYYCGAAGRVIMLHSVR